MILLLILLVVWFSIKQRHATYHIEIHHEVQSGPYIERTLVPPEAYDDRFMEL